MVLNLETKAERCWDRVYYSWCNSILLYWVMYPQKNSWTDLWFLPVEIFYIFQMITTDVSKAVLTKKYSFFLTGIDPFKTRINARDATKIFVCTSLQNSCVQLSWRSKNSYSQWREGIMTISLSWILTVLNHDTSLVMCSRERACLIIRCVIEMTL